MPALRKYALDAASYGDLRQAQLARLAPSNPRIDRIEIVTGGRVPPDYIRSHLDVKVGDRYDAETMREAMQALMTSGRFEKLTHELIEAGGETTLRVEARAVFNAYFQLGRPFLRTRGA